MKQKTQTTIMHLLGIVIVICAVAEGLYKDMTLSALALGLGIGMLYFLFTYLARIPILGLIVFGVVVYLIWLTTGLVSYLALIVCLIPLAYYTIESIGMLLSLYFMCRGK